MASEAKLRANSKSNKINTKMICVRLSYNTDADIIKKLDEVDSKMGYIKELIRKDMQAQKKIVCIFSEIVFGIFSVKIDVF
jgi:hypothetical protein